MQLLTEAELKAIVVTPPTKEEADARPALEKATSEFDWFYDSGEPNFFEGTNKEKLCFSSNRKAGKWIFSVGEKQVLQSANAHLLIKECAKYM
jgi:hypothetical protein